MEIEISNQQENSLYSSNLNEISCVSSDELSYNQFFHQFMSKNIPVFIKGIEIKTKFSSEWFDGKDFKLEKLKEIIKDHEVPVANYSKKYFDSHEKIKMTFTDYEKYWNGDRQTDTFYLKDFHLKQEFPELDFYKVPMYFSSDWLNEYLIDKKLDDYRFIYIGPKDSW